MGAIRIVEEERRRLPLGMKKVGMSLAKVFTMLASCERGYGVFVRRTLLVCSKKKCNWGDNVGYTPFFLRHVGVEGWIVCISVV